MAAVYDVEDEKRPLSASEQAKQEEGFYKPEADDEQSDSGGHDRVKTKSKPGGTPDLGTIKEAEETPSSPKEPAGAAAEQSLLSRDGLWKNPAAKATGGLRFLSRLTGRQKAAGGGLIGLVVGGGIMLFSFVQAPLEFIHKAQLLSKFHFTAHDHFGDDRSAKFVYYMLVGKSQRGRLGVINNKIADKYEAHLNDRSGLKSVYSNTTGRLIGYEVLDENKARPFLKELDDDIPRTTTIRGTDFNGDGSAFTHTSSYVDFSDAKFSNRRSIVRTATRSLGVNKISSTLVSRLHIKRAGVNFSPLSRFKQTADDFLEGRNLLKEQIDNEIETGNPDSPDPPSLGRRNLITEKIRSFLNSAKGPAAAAAMICGIKSFSDSIDAQNFENIQQLKRLGMKDVTVGFQAMSGDLDMDSLASLAAYNYDEETKTTWSADPGIQQESGQEPTGVDYNQDVKPGSKEKPLIFRAIDSVPTSFFGLNVCGAIEAASNIPGIKQASDAFSSALNSALNAVGIPSPDDLALRARDYFATGGVDVVAEGAERGGLGNIGVRLAANDQFVASGGRELTDDEAATVKEFAQAELEHERNQASLFDRYLNIQESDSVVAQAYMSSPKNSQQLASSIASLPSMLGNIASSLLGNSKVAAATAYDYGFPLYGFSEAEQNNPDFDNGYANADYVEQEGKLEALNNTYGNQCFGMTISRAGDLVYSTAVDPNKIPDACKSDVPDLIKYRFYIADMVTAHTLACYEGEEDSCSQLGFGNISAGAGAAVSSQGQDTSAQSCSVGTDAGIGETPDPTKKIRLCRVSNLTVNVAIEKNVDAIVRNSASAGLAFGDGEGYRPPGIQLERRRDNCGSSQYDLYEKPAGQCTPPTAQPGESLHEWGLAVDLRCNGSIIQSRSSACFQWLAENTELHNLINLPSEPWHWSASGG